jgi:hypothetical protein
MTAAAAPLARAIPLRAGAAGVGEARSARASRGPSSGDRLQIARKRGAFSWSLSRGASCAACRDEFFHALCQQKRFLRFHFLHETLEQPEPSLLRFEIAWRNSFGFVPHRFPCPERTPPNL